MLKTSKLDTCAGICNVSVSAYGSRSTRAGSAWMRSGLGTNQGSVTSCCACTADASPFCPHHQRGSLSPSKSILVACLAHTLTLQCGRTFLLLVHRSGHRARDRPYVAYLSLLDLHRPTSLGQDLVKSKSNLVPKV